MRHLLLSAVCVAATDSNATFGALADRVEWTRVNDKASYDWPNSTLRHFSPAEAMDLLRGRQVLVLGNSVARHVVVALHRLISGRAPDAGGGVTIGGQELPEAEVSIWPGHGAGAAEVAPEKDYVSEPCKRKGGSRIRSFCPSWLLGCAGTDCCVARHKASKTSMLLTYAFTGTPAEIQIHRALKRWAGTPHCAGASSPDYAVLFMTEVNHKAFQRLAKHSAELKIRHPRTTFILVTPPHTQCDDRTIRKSEKLCKRGENRSALEAYDVAAVEAATPFDGVVVVPIGESTARGLSEGALRHEVTNPYHFHDAGRLFVLEMLLNAFAIARPNTV